MIILWVITALFLIDFIVSMIKDRRQFKNAILFFLTAGFTVMSLYLNFIDVKWVNKLAEAILILIPIIMTMAALMMLIATFWLVYRNGITVTSLLPSVFAIAIVLMLTVTVIFGVGASDSAMYLLLLQMSAYTLLYLGVTFVSYLMYSILYSIMPKKNDYKYIIIHGARVFGTKPSKLLSHRIDKAIQLYKKCNGKAIIIASGGKGDDEDISEAQAIKEYLLSKDIVATNIITEDKSTTTMENLKFSKEFTGDEKCAFVTNNYHALRVSIFARSLNMKGDAYGCKTAWYYLPTGFIREYIAMLVIEKKSFIIYTITMLLVSLITTFIIK